MDQNKFKLKALKPSIFASIIGTCCFSFALLSAAAPFCRLPDLNQPHSSLKLFQSFVKTTPLTFVSIIKTNQVPSDDPFTAARQAALNAANAADKQYLPTDAQRLYPDPKPVNFVSLAIITNSIVQASTLAQIHIYSPGGSGFETFVNDQTTCLGYDIQALNQQYQTAFLGYNQQIKHPNVPVQYPFPDFNHFSSNTNKTTLKKYYDNLPNFSNEQQTILTDDKANVKASLNSIDKKYPIGAVDPIFHEDLSVTTDLKTLNAAIDLCHDKLALDPYRAEIQTADNSIIPGWIFTKFQTEQLNALQADLKNLQYAYGLVYLGYDTMLDGTSLKYKVPDYAGLQKTGDYLQILAYWNNYSQYAFWQQVLRLQQIAFLKTQYQQTSFVYREYLNGDLLQYQLPDYLLLATQQKKDIDAAFANVKPFNQEQLLIYQQDAARHDSLFYHFDQMKSFLNNFLTSTPSATTWQFNSTIASNQLALTIQNQNILGFWSEYGFIVWQNQTTNQWHLYNPWLGINNQLVQATWNNPTQLSLTWQNHQQTPCQLIIDVETLSTNHSQQPTVKLSYFENNILLTQYAINIALQSLLVSNQNIVTSGQIFLSFWDKQPVHIFFNFASMASFHQNLWTLASAYYFDVSSTTKMFYQHYAISIDGFTNTVKAASASEFNQLLVMPHPQVVSTVLLSIWIAIVISSLLLVSGLWWRLHHQTKSSINKLI